MAEATQLPPLVPSEGQEQPVDGSALAAAAPAAGAEDDPPPPTPMQSILIAHVAKNNDTDGGSADSDSAAKSSPMGALGAPIGDAYATFRPTSRTNTWVR